MTARDTPLARRAALLLHGMLPSEAREVLARLTSAEQHRLGPLLEELAGLGVEPASAAVLAGPLPAPEPAGHDAAAHVADVRTRTEALDAAVVEQCLRSCAPHTAASLLRATPWPWRDRVLDLMPQPRRAEVRDAMRSETVALGPAVLDVWCERLTEQALELRLHGTRAQARQASLSLSAIGAWLRQHFPWKR